ncbi:hypothetical protein [Mycobacterium intracellulare]|nr:hypothetical protein [Mycobacterium intracellulare]
MMIYTRVESLLTHSLMYIVALGIAADVVVVFSPVPGLVTGAMGLTVAGIMANMFHRRSAALCVRCITEVPVDAPVRAQRRKRILWLEHAIATMTGRLVLVGATVALMLLPSVAHAAVAVHLSRILPGLVLWGLVYVDTLHHRLRPWCPYCRDWDDDCDAEPSPDPTAFGTKTRTLR